MASKVTFDGENKLIIIKSGTTNIDIGVDLYSDWKEWVIDNPNWLPAFRTFGGDETSENQYAPRYYFLINNWRVLANNINCVMQTNLYSDDYDSPFIINNSSITIRNSDVPIIKSELEQRLDYGDRIYYDETSIYTGIDYPNGTIAQPINNFRDAILIGNKYNIKDFYSLSNITLSGITGETFEDYSIFSDRENLIAIITGNTFINTDWNNFIIDIDFNSGKGNLLNECIILNALNINGKLTKCQIGTDLYKGIVKIDNTLVMSYCYSGVAGDNTPLFDMNVNKETFFSNRGYSGGIEIKNCNTSGSTSTIELIAGQVKLHESCTNGYIDLRGVGYITDNSSGTTIKTLGFIDNFEESKETNEIISYNNTLYFNISGFTGYTYPIGTLANPVNNIIDLITLSNKLNIRNIVSKSSFVISGITEFRDYTIKSEHNNNFYMYNGNKSYGLNIIGFNIHGDFKGNYNKFINCQLINVYGLHGMIINSNLEGELHIQNNTTFVDSYPSFANGNPHIYLTNTGGTNVSFRNYNGTISIDKIINNNDKISIDLNAGHLIITSGCTNGLIDVRGVGYVTDMSLSGVTVHRDGQLQSTPYYYNNTIIIDTIKGESGILYPIGTQERPVNNINNALTLLSNYNLNKLKINGNLLIDNNEDISNLILTSDNNINNLTITDAITNNTIINNLTCDIVQSGSCKYDNCVILNIDNFDGYIKNSLFIGNINITGNKSNYFMNCSKFINDMNSIIIDISNKKLNIIECNGNYKIINKISNNVTSINMLSGVINIDNSCSNGTMIINGTCDVIDNSNSGCTVINNTLSVNRISDGVWDESIMEHQITGSTGYDLHNISAGASPIAIAQEVWNTQLSGFTQNSAGYMLSSVFNATSGNTTDITELKQDVKRILGLTQENFLIKDHVYDNQNQLESATIKIFNNSTDCNNDVNSLAEYSMTALYDSNGRLINYKVTKN